MYIEVRPQALKKKYYLVHGYSWFGKTKRFVQYLGSNLSPEELAIKRKEAEPKLKKKLAELQVKERVYPIYAGVDEVELEEIRSMQRRIKKSIKFTEDDWKKFAGAFVLHSTTIENMPPVMETGISVALDFIRTNKENPSIELIKKLHSLIFERSEFRDGKAIEQLNELIRWYKYYEPRYPAFVLAVTFHNQFMLIQPFESGNEIIGKLVMNNILIKNWLPPVDIDTNNKSHYKAVKAYQRNRNIRPMIELVTEEYRELNALKK